MNSNILLTRKEIYGLLRERRLNHPYTSIMPRWLSPTIGRLQKLAKLDQEKYQSYMRLIDSMLAIAKKEKVGVRTLILHLPSLNALLSIDLDTLLQDQAAREEIVFRCYTPTKGMIDLRHLEHIIKDPRFAPQLVIAKH